MKLVQNPEADRFMLYFKKYSSWDRINIKQTNLVKTLTTGKCKIKSHKRSDNAERKTGEDKKKCDYKSRAGVPV